VEFSSIWPPRMAYPLQKLPCKPRHGSPGMVALVRAVPRTTGKRFLPALLIPDRLPEESRVMPELRSPDP
ncbi:MAG: hypothetical protein ACPHF4_06830, partial [Rubripirellula sp.]